MTWLRARWDTSAVRSREEAPGGLPDADVVARVLAGEVDLYEILMRRNNQRLYRAVRSILSDEAEVEDVLQEAYLSAYDHLGDFAGRSSFSTWLTRIAINKALDRKRRSGRLVALEAADTASPHAQPGVLPLATRSRDPEQESVSLELAGLLARAVDALPARYRSVYVLREIEGMSTREAADCLDLEAGTVKTRLHRARAILRESLYRDGGAWAKHTFTFAGERCDSLVAVVLRTLADRAS